MADIAYDNSSAQGGINATSLTFSKTCSGTDLFLIVWLKVYGLDDITGVTYNGVALTQSNQTPADLVEGTRCRAWYLIGPDTGTHDVVVSRATAGFIIANAESYTGVNQNAPEDQGSDSVSGTQSAPSVTVVSSGVWLIGGAISSYTGNPFTDSSNGKLRRDNDTIAIGLLGSYDSDDIVSTGAQALDMTKNNTALNYSGIVFAIAPATAGSTGKPTNYYTQQTKQ